MNLPSPPSAYSASDQAAMRDEIQRADGQNLKRGGDLEPGKGRVILRAPNGSRWVLAVSNAGALSATAL